MVKTEALVQSFNKLQDSLEEKKNVLEQFQGHLQTLFDWQRELDRLNMRAQVLLETCADTRISNGVTQLTTKYNALLSLAKEIMRRLELHYQEHQQHNTLYGECQDWVERTHDKLNECQECPGTLQEVNSKLNLVKNIRQSLEQGQNKLRYALELKERVIMNTEQNGAAKIQEDTENLKQEFDKLLVDVQDMKQKLTNRAAQLEEIHKLHKQLTEWLEEVENKINLQESPLNDLSEKKAALEKYRTLQREFSNNSELILRIKSKLADDDTLDSKEFTPSLDKYEKLLQHVTESIAKLAAQAQEHENYKKAFNDAYEWIRKARYDIQRCASTHGEKQEILDKIQNLDSIRSTLPQGKECVDQTIELSNSVIKNTGSEGQHVINEEIKQLKSDWETIQNNIKDSNNILNGTIDSWNTFTSFAKNLKSWLRDMSERAQEYNNENKKTPADLKLVKVSYLYYYSYIIYIYILL